MDREYVLFINKCFMKKINKVVLVIILKLFFYIIGLGIRMVYFILKSIIFKGIL